MVPELHLDQHVFFRALGTTHKVLSASLDGSTAIVEHTLEAHSLGAPLHKHTREDEISFILEGELTVMQEGVIQTAGPGQYIAKPRNIFHTFWNATPARIRWVEVITPGHFEHYFSEIEPYLKQGEPPQFDKLAETAARYGLIMDPAASEGIIRQHGLKPLS